MHIYRFVEVQDNGRTLLHVATMLVCILILHSLFGGLRLLTSEMKNLLGNQKLVCFERLLAYHKIE